MEEISNNSALRLTFRYRGAKNRCAGRLVPPTLRLAELLISAHRERPDAAGRNSR